MVSRWINLAAAGLLLMIGQTLAEAPATRPVLTPRNDLAGLSNFAQVSPGLYRGAQPTSGGFATLKSMGIKTIVNLRADHDDTKLLAGTGLRYVHIPCRAWYPQEADVVAFLKLMQNAENLPVFVHCEHGADRTGMMVAAYRMVEQGWTAKEAMVELPRFGFHTVWQTIRWYLGGLDPEAMRKKIAAAREPKIVSVN